MLKTIDRIRKISDMLNLTDDDWSWYNEDGDFDPTIISPIDLYKSRCTTAATMFFVKNPELDEVTIGGIKFTGSKSLRDKGVSHIFRANPVHDSKHPLYVLQRRNWDIMGRSDRVIEEIVAEYLEHRAILLSYANYLEENDNG